MWYEGESLFAAAPRRLYTLPQKGLSIRAASLCEPRPAPNCNLGMYSCGNDKSC
jgi:hypothetical protein